MSGTMGQLQQQIRDAVLQWSGVSLHAHRYGGIEFRLGKRELGHVHGDRVVDIPFPMKTRNQLLEEGRVERHHVLPDSGWVSFYLRGPNDVPAAIELLHHSWELAQRAKPAQPPAPISPKARNEKYIAAHKE